MNKEKIKVEIYTNADRAFEDEADEILKDNDKKAIINILRNNFDLEDSLLELKELQEENKMQDHELERLRNIIKEVRELRKKISNCYYEDGFELDTPMLLEYIDEILDKENK